jgi:hypothetical protein
MPPLSTATISLELLQDCFGTLEQVATSLTVLALTASKNPEQLPRIRSLLGVLLANIQDCEEQLGTYDLLDG